jgi:secreted PhoX family phosphatase
MSVDDTPSNHSDNRLFDDVLRARISRRGVMIGGLATAATTFFAAATTGGSVSAATGRQPGPNAPKNPQALLGFTPSANDGGPNPTVSPDYAWYPVLPWGAPLFAGVAAFNTLDTSLNTADAQERQIGIGHDGMWFFADNGSNTRGVLCLNHEFGINPTVLGKPAPESTEDVRKSQAAHGVSVIEFAQQSGKWDAVVPGARNRRIHGNTPVAFSGPAAGSELLQTPAGNAPAGTLNNCGYGKTPWGTYLTCEENFNGYFGSKGDWTATPEQERYGFEVEGFGYGWHLFDNRFDLSNAAYRNEENRFGWIVEIDPNDPSSVPVKRTALGRVKHEGAATVVGRGGRLVVYMGDDEAFDYIYKFVSAGNWKSMRARGISPLDHGTLYVARFNDDGSGDWLPLTTDNPALAGWSIDAILVFTRLAADLVGATKMDRPEWTDVDQWGNVYCTLTNNGDRRVADAANPVAPNPDGHIIKWRDNDNHVGTRFEWDIFLLAKDWRGNADWEFTDPDGLWADPDGRVFIQTDGGQPNGRNNQMVVADSFTGELRRIFAGVSGDEITGVAITPDRQTMFINSQHPGNGNRTSTNFPVPGAGGPDVPRDSTIVLTRKGGGIIGS